MRDGIFYNMSQNKLLNPPVRCTRHETVKNACWIAVEVCFDEIDDFSSKFWFWLYITIIITENEVIFLFIYFYINYLIEISLKLFFTMNTICPLFIIYKPLIVIYII